MKKRIQALVMSIVLILSMSVSSVVFAADNITVKLNGKILIFDVQPQIINGRTMVPMRTIFEELGASVDWDGATQTITSVKGDTTIRLTIGVPNIKINQQIPRDLDTAPCIVDGRTLVPVRAISEAFHMNVDWDGATQTVLITPPNVNMTAYNTLKNAILTRGEKSSTGSNYYIYYRPSSKEYSMMFSYEPTDDFIAIFFKEDSSLNGLETTACIFLYEDMNPSVLYTLKFSSGEEYIMHADFENATQPYVVTSTTIPDYLSYNAVKLLNSIFSLMDLETTLQTGVSFSNLGIFYVED